MRAAIQNEMSAESEHGESGGSTIIMGNNVVF